VLYAFPLVVKTIPLSLPPFLPPSFPSSLPPQLNITYDIAGVTFLALGNGAPDVFSSIAAFSSSDPSVVLIGICELLGASVFVTTVVVGAVALLHPASVRPQAFTRDILFQLLANLLLTATALYGRVTFALAFVYLSLYALYVLVVLHLDRAQRRASAASPLSLTLDGGQKAGDGGREGEGSGVLSAFWFTASDVSEFHRATETASVHKLPHDILLNDDKLSSKSKGEKEDEEGEEELGWSGGEGRRNQNVDARGGRHPFTHSLIGEYFIGEGGRMDGSALLPPPPPPPSQGSSQQKQQQQQQQQKQEEVSPKMPMVFLSSSRTSAKNNDSNSSSSSSSSSSANSSSSPSFIPFNTCLGKGDAYMVTDTNTNPPPSHPPSNSSPSRLPSLLPHQHHRRYNSSVWDNMYWQHWRLRRRLLREFHSSGFLQQNLFWKLLTLLHFPLLLARNLTIPLVEEEAWSRSYASLCPLFAPPFLLHVGGKLNATFGESAFPAWMLVACCGGVGAVLVRLTTHDSRPPSSFMYVMVLAVVAFLMCSAWIYTIATELVAVVTALGVLLSLPPSLLGLTLLAWGNSAGDLITNIAVARAGLSDMAVAGCFAGPTFNLLVGLGCSFLWKVWLSGPFTLDFDERAYISLSFLYIALGVNLGVGYWSGFRLGETLAWPLIGLYACCTLLQVVLIGVGMGKR